MKTSTTAIIASVAVLIAVGMFYNGSSLNPKTIDNGVPIAAFATGTTVTPTDSDGFFVFSSGKAKLVKNQFIGFGAMGKVGETFAAAPYGTSTDKHNLQTIAFNVDNSPGTGKSWTATVFKNGVSTALSCTISGSETECTESHGDITVVANDEINVKITSSTSKPKTTTGTVTVTDTDLSSTS